MAVIKTTQSPRLVTFAGNVSTTCGALTTPINNLILHAEFGADALLLQLPPSVGPPTPLFTIGVRISGTNFAASDFNHTYVDSISIGCYYGFGMSITTPHLLPVGTNTGSYSFTVTLQQWSSFTSVNGRSATESFIDIPVPGSGISGTFSFGGQTVSFSGVVPVAPGYPIVWEGGGGHYVDLEAAVDPVQLITGAMTVSVGGALLGQTISLPFTHIYPGGEVLDMTGGISLSANGLAGYTGGYRATLSREVTKQITTEGRINAISIAYPSALVTEWTPFPQITTPPLYTPFTIGDTISLDNYTGALHSWASNGSGTGGVILPAPPTLFMGDGISCRIQPLSLYNNGEQNQLPLGPISDPNAWNNQLRARLTPFNACTIYQAANIILDPCTSATGWSSNVTLVSGFLNVNTASSGIATKTYPTALVSEGYRYLEIDIKPLTTSGGTVTLGLKNTGVVWQYKETLGSSGVLTTIRFDLLAPFTFSGGIPSNLGTSVVLDCKYQQVGPSNAEGYGWGIDAIKILSLTFAGGTGSYSIQQIRMVRDANTRITLLQSDNWETEHDAGGPQVYKDFLANTDGKRSANIGDLFTGRGIGSLPFFTRFISAALGTFSDVLNKITGWTVTPNATVFDQNAWYFQWNLCYLCGGGAIYTGGSTPLSEWINHEVVSNPTQLMVQAMAGSVGVTPQCGDIVHNGAGNAPFKYYIWEYLRQFTEGIAIDKTQLPISGDSVTETETLTGNVSGSGTTDATGYFITGSNFAKTIPFQRDTLSGATPGTGVIAFQPRPRDLLRLGFLSTVTVGSASLPWQVQSTLGQIHLASVQDGDVLYERADQPTPNPSWSVSGKVTTYGDVVSVAMEIDPAINRIHMLVTRFAAGAYSVYILTSDSDGRYFSTGTLLSMAALGATVWKEGISAIGYTYFVYDAGTSGPGVQKAVFSEGSGQAFGSVYTFKTAAGADIKIADKGWSNVCESNQYSNALVWCPILDGATVPTVLLSYNNGKSWG